MRGGYRLRLVGLLEDNVILKDLWHDEESCVGESWREREMVGDQE